LRASQSSSGVAGFASSRTGGFDFLGSPSSESQHTLHDLGIMDWLQTLSQRKRILSITNLSEMHCISSNSKNSSATNVDFGYAAKL
jgi:hypothetical protein